MDERSEKLDTKFWWIYFLVAGLILVGFIWRVATPGGEFPMPPMHYFDMLLNLALLVVLIAARRQIARHGDADDPRVVWGGFVFYPALIAGIGLTLLRFTSDHAWWTGHLMR